MVSNKIEECSSDDSEDIDNIDSSKFFDRTEENSKYTTLIKSERQKSLHLGFR